jgi:hypothetical protein
MEYAVIWILRTRALQTVSALCPVQWCELIVAEDIRKALKAVDLMKILDGQTALGNKSNSKTIGEHKVHLSMLNAV